MFNFVAWAGEVHSKIADYIIKKKHPDWCWDENNCGSMQFVWGVKSGDDLTNSVEANLHTLNDIDIIYDRETGMYSLGIETAYIFESKKDEIEYLSNLLDLFSKYMIQHNYCQHEAYNLWMINPKITLEAASIPELYAQFKIFVEGYKVVYQYPIRGADNND